MWHTPPSISENQESLYLRARTFEALQPLIPTFILAQFERGILNGRFRAYTLFADLSGFTAMTEALMQRSTEGAEELSRVLNSIFGPTVHEVYLRGGMIPYFAGDSFMGIFPEGTPFASPEGLLDTATQLRAFFEQRLGAAHEAYNIGIKIGLGEGTIDWGIVGTDRHAFFFRGEAVKRCAEAQMIALESQIVAHKSLALRLPPELITENKAAYWLIQPAPEPLSGIEKQPYIQDERHAALLPNFLPQSVLDLDNVGEFRAVVSVFIAFEGTDEGDSLNQLATVVLSQLDRFGGYFKEIDFGDKGGVMVCFFGAPIAFENNETRALEFVQILREEVAALQQSYPIKLRIGISSGIAYTGMIGGAERMQYAVAGTRVNLAARLMLRAKPGIVLTDDEVQRNKFYKFKYEGNQAYKGITLPVGTYQLVGRNQDESAIYSGQMIGRQHELGQLLRFVKKHFEQQKGGIFFIFGDSGVGKSRLTFELEKTLQKENPNLFWFTCHTEPILQKPFNPFSYFFKYYFEQSVERSIAENNQIFDERFVLLTNILATNLDKKDSVLTELVRTKSVLKALVGLYETDSLFDQLDGRSRYETTIAAVINLLVAVAKFNQSLSNSKMPFGSTKQAATCYNKCKAALQIAP